MRNHSTNNGLKLAKNLDGNRARFEFRNQKFEFRNRNSDLAAFNRANDFTGRSTFTKQSSRNRKTKFRSVSIDSFDRGNWAASIRSDLNYLSEPGSYGVGEGFNTATTQSVGDLFRNFFTFQLPRLQKGEKIVRATLRITKGFSGGDSVERFGLFDVSSSIAILNHTERTNDNIAQTGISPAIYNDLGTGKNYGLFNVRTTGSFSFDGLNLRLNSNAVRDINRSRRHLFSIGGSIQSLNNTTTPIAEVLFASGNSSSVVQLKLQIQSQGK